MPRCLLLALAAVVVALPLCVQAQDGGPYLTRGEDSHVEIKKPRWPRWVRLNPLSTPLSEEDSVYVESGSGVRLYRGDDRHVELTSGQRYRVGDALQQEQGMLARLRRAGVNAAQTLSRLIVQQPATAVRVSRDLVDRSDDAEQPALLFTAEEPPWPVATEDFRLVWLPAIPVPDTTTQVRVFQTSAEACQGGRLVLDTLVTGNRLHLPAHRLEWTGGTRYRVELADPEDALYDVGCFVVATPEARAALATQIAEVRSDLGSTSEESASTFDRELHVAGLLIHEGYYYDAFLALDRLMERAPNDPSLLTLWSALLAQTGVLDDPGDGR